MFRVGEMIFGGSSIKKYVLHLGPYSKVDIFAGETGLSYQKLSAVTRKHNGRFRKRRLGGGSYIRVNTLPPKIF